MFGVFMHKEDSIYDDLPHERYQFPKQYLRRAKEFEGGWVLYYQPGSKARVYFAYAKVEKIIPDPTAPDMYLALIAPNSYEDFDRPVPFKLGGELMEKSLANAEGNFAGRAVWAVRPIPADDFNRIFDCGMAETDFLLPRTDEEADVAEDQVQFEFDQERQRESIMINKAFRDRRFRRKVLRAYDERCAFTGLKLINGGGRAEVQAAHIKPVAANGPDSVRNGIALSGTLHWMFDRGLLSLQDDLEIMVSRHINDRNSIDNLIRKSGYAAKPEHPGHEPHPAFLEWHRDEVFKV
ncbi:MAG: restriction endonuclease [Hellea sp.]|nr:restriction endonuclease [Hellea sp.]